MFLTSVPEAIVSLSAAFKGEIAMAYGNIWGSVVANSTMVIAGAALYKPVKCRVLITHKEMPLLLVVIGVGSIFTYGLAIDATSCYIANDLVVIHKMGT